MKKYKLISIFLAIAIIFNMGVPAAEALMHQDTEVIKNRKPIDFTQEAIDADLLFISADLAGEIAMLFVADMVEAGVSNWTPMISITDIVTMYDGTEERNIVAYTVELNSGYVVISAYGDVPNIVLEWSDEAMPLYEQFTLNENDDIVYGGSLYYYKDDGSRKLQTLGGTSIDRDEISNIIATTRDYNNVPAAIREALVNAEINIGSDEICTTPGSSGVITDPFTHASTWYNGSYSANDWENYWEPNGTTVECHSTSEYRNLGNGYVKHCGPTAITNMLVMYGNRFGVSSITNEDDSDIFIEVARVGTSNGYYYNTDFLGMGGTFSYCYDDYIFDSFSAYNVSGISVNGRYTINYTNIKNSLRNDRLLLLCLSNHDCYKDHAVICYAYTRLVSNVDGSYVTYLKVADGWANSPRYIDMASVDGSKYWEVEY